MSHLQLSDKIKKLRNHAGLSQGALGGLLGLSAGTVSKWENGSVIPPVERLARLSDIFNVSLDYFYSKEDEPKPVISAEITGMESLSELYKAGRGPSSSHTIGPERAVKIFKENHPEADGFKVILYGSLAKTGIGHGTDRVILKTFAPIPCEVFADTFETDLPHPNTMDMIALKNGKEIDSVRVMSIGGGKICFLNETVPVAPVVYELHNFREISDHCADRMIRLWQYAEEVEGPEIAEYMSEIWSVMKESIRSGLKDEGTLPGGLDVKKKAKKLFHSEHVDESPMTRENRLVCAYAFAVSEQNAAGERVVTAPTCGAAGVLPAVLYYQQQKQGYSDIEIVHALMTGGIIGNLIKTNASISGAECGCQAEIGTACAMAAASLGELFGLSLDKIEYAAEIAIEHHLGLTCDPICGLVQIPCIERNAVAAMRAINAVNIASFLSDTRKISLDNVIHVMKETGLDLSHRYKETAEAGMAKLKL